MEMHHYIYKDSYNIATLLEEGLQSEDDTTRLLVPWTSRKTFATHSFSVLGPQLWNDLPRQLHKIDNYANFKKELKTHLFKVAFLGHQPSR